jgi:hypothetical protein
MAADELSKLLPNAKQMMEQLALAEAEKASEEMRNEAKAEAEKKALLDKLTRPSGVSDEQALKRVATIVQRAVKNGFTEVEVFRFPNAMCTDRGRAINNNLEAGWEKTLTCTTLRRSTCRSPVPRGLSSLRLDGMPRSFRGRRSRAA